MTVSFTRYTNDSAEGESRQILQQIEKQYGFVPELFTYMAESPAILKAYLKLDELLQDATLPPDLRQIALLTVSTANDCEFCQVAHHAMARQSGVDQETARVIREGGEPDGARSRALVRFVRAMMEKRGWLDDADLNRFLDAGFTREQIYEVILILSIKTLSNYANHLTYPEPNPELLAMTRE